MNGKKIINVGQMTVMLILSSLFSIIAYGPAAAVTGGEAMMAILISVLAQAAVFIPLYFLLRREEDPVDQLYRKSKGAARLTAALYGLLFLLTAADTLASFTYLLKTEFYPSDGSLVFLVIMGAALFYCVTLGVEALSRMALIVFVVAILSLVMVFGSMVRELDLLNIILPAQINLGKLMFSSQAMLARSFEGAALLFLAPLAKGNLKNGMSTLLLMALVIFELTTLYIVGTMGSYAALQDYPFLSLLSMTELSVLGRLDAVHLMVWVFVAFVKAMVFLQAAGLAAEKLFRPRQTARVKLIATVLTVLTAFFLSDGLEMFTGFHQVFRTAWLYLIFVVILPLIILVAGRKGGKKA